MRTKPLISGKTYNLHGVAASGSQRTILSAAKGGNRIGSVLLVLPAACCLAAEISFSATAKDARIHFLLQMAAPTVSPNQMPKANQITSAVMFCSVFVFLLL